MEPLPDVLRHFHPVLPATALRKKPMRVEVAGRAYALFRDAEGRPAALADACPHRFAPLSKGRVRADGRLQCPYHGWRFDAQGQGANPSQPELRHCDVKSFQVVEHRGYLWLAHRDTPLSSLPELPANDGYLFGGSFSVLFEAPLHVALDNFSEDEHTPYVHTRLGWDDPHAGQVEFKAHNLEDHTEVFYRAPQRPAPLMKLLGVRDGDLFRNEWVTRFDPVHSQYTVSWEAPSGKQRPFITRANIFFVPETAKTTRLHVFSFLRCVQPLLKPFLPVAARVAMELTRWEVVDDARFIPTVADTPYSHRGMRLDRYDKPLVHQRRLMERIYFRQPRTTTTEDELPAVTLAREAVG
ncbi:Rieske 2Fe-2S domain-containing protein [Myxococcus llanfairpwllgwyngyllgogerychwyrndrobwllllantysiliogogogochensis]|uniref:Rieske 2Fe-2S domain-containing protein n=1 Tax=Myxococcus llanfairpwllgwyngyllgogerychwyrndrobwllllantysiliogogogochensis TaxID=2590453 RepID=A0A540X9J7_9BACT|nr:Rieske 2Fe-2S domain-containing protein [Myxococcus llanfairpwllgwyngyllgogerychwyrndrobwllllantysiliogogogochensis]TQF17798.1 Rieske 2Fe-2S domain-containing protein [Myxococcus llanfairpwllgwyngyllgogerychwyrndrobwllllantysiliogogogochensis]